MAVSAFLAGLSCDRFLASPVFTMECTTPLLDAVHVMRTAGVTSALVTVDAGPEGEVSVGDVIRSPLPINPPPFPLKACPCNSHPGVWLHDAFL
jgi:CBS domain-containing protein